MTPTPRTGREAFCKGAKNSTKVKEVPTVKSLKQFFRSNLNLSFSKVNRNANNTGSGDQSKMLLAKGELSIPTIARTYMGVHIRSPIVNMSFRTSWSFWYRENSLVAISKSRVIRPAQRIEK